MGWSGTKTNENCLTIYFETIELLNKTNRQDMTMRIQGGKMWNSILLNDININNNI